MAVEIKEWETPGGSPLSRYLESFVVYQFSTREVVQFYPEGCCELLFQVDGEFLHRSLPTSDWIKRPKGFVGGLHQHNYLVQPLTENARCLGLKFRPGAASFFIPQPMKKFKNQVVGIDQIWSKHECNLAKFISSTAENHLQFAALENFLMPKYHRNPHSERLQEVCCTIADHNGSKPIYQLASESFYSLSYFRKCFETHIGLPPKRFSQVIRVRSAMKALQVSRSQSLTSLAHRLGYFDQAHFIREFKSITHRTPREYVRGQ